MRIQSTRLDFPSARRLVSTSPAPVAIETPLRPPPRRSNAEAPPAAPPVPDDELSGDAGPVVSDDDEETDRRLVRFYMPSWLLSAITHMAALIVLALITLAPEEIVPQMEVAGAVAEEAEEALEELAIEVSVPEEVPQTETTDSSAPGESFDAMADFTGAETAATQEPTLDVGFADTAIGQVAGLFGSDGRGFKEFDMPAGATSFFGVKTKGNRFVYVVDNSNSMGRGRFEAAVQEILRSVDRLSNRNSFYVVFFSDTAYPLFYPQTATTFVPATQENKYRLEQWLGTVQRCLRTRGKEAMSLALSLRPDVIYLLGDGAFTDDTVDTVLTQKGLPTVIHTMGFDMKAKDRDGFAKIADAFRGQFHNVEVPQEMVDLDRRLNRPKNSTRNGIWGIQLPAK